MMVQAVVADDEVLARQKLRQLLREMPEIEVVGESATAAETIDLVRATKPDLLFLDVRMPMMGGFEFLEEYEKIANIDKEGIKIFMLSSSLDPLDLRTFCLASEEEQIAWKRLIRVLGHELSNSLAPIKSIAGSLLARVDRMQGDDTTLHDFRRGLGVVESRADGLHRFVQSYRLLAQLPPPQFKPVALGALLDRVVLLEQRLAVLLEPGPSIVLNADPDQLEQMFINLLANAVDASLANGAQPVRVGWRLDESALLVAIEDRGMGIANAENLFVPFYTTKPAGSGVGLALAQQIARAHGGEIALVNREDGEGARATIRLPLGIS